MIAVEELVKKYGVNINHASQFGLTPLNNAVQLSGVAITQLNGLPMIDKLLMLGANPHVVSYPDNETPLQHAEKYVRYAEEYVRESRSEEELQEGQKKLKLAREMVTILSAAENKTQKNNS
jgi:hypothetical protein